MLWDQGPAARHLKGDKKDRLVERKVCFMLDSGKWVEPILCWNSDRVAEDSCLSKARLLRTIKYRLL